MFRPRNRQSKFFSKVFFLDVLFDPEIRPVFIYVVIIIMIGAMLFHWLEGWAWLDAIYFVVVTLTTIGMVT